MDVDTISAKFAEHLSAQYENGPTDGANLSSQDSGRVSPSAQKLNKAFEDTFDPINDQNWGIDKHMWIKLGNLPIKDHTSDESAGFRKYSRLEVTIPIVRNSDGIFNKYIIPIACIDFCVFFVFPIEYESGSSEIFAELSYLSALLVAVSTLMWSDSFPRTSTQTILDELFAVSYVWIFYSLSMCILTYLLKICWEHYGLRAFGTVVFFKIIFACILLWRTRTLCKRIIQAQIEKRRFIESYEDGKIRDIGDVPSTFDKAFDKVLESKANGNTESLVLRLLFFYVFFVIVTFFLDIYQADKWCKFEFSKSWLHYFYPLDYVYLLRASFLFFVIIFQVTFPIVTNAAIKYTIPIFSTFFVFPIEYKAGSSEIFAEILYSSALLTVISTLAWSVSFPSTRDHNYKGLLNEHFDLHGTVLHNLFEASNDLFVVLYVWVICTWAMYALTYLLELSWECFQFWAFWTVFFLKLLICVCIPLWRTRALCKRIIQEQRARRSFVYTETCVNGLLFLHVLWVVGSFLHDFDQVGKLYYCRLELKDCEFEIKGPLLYVSTLVVCGASYYYIGRA